MNKTKDPITRSYKKKKTIREQNRLFPLFSCTHAHTFISDTSNDPGWCFACTKGGRICPEWCETVRQRLWIIPRANKVAYPGSRWPTRDSSHIHRDYIYIYRFPSYAREDQRFKAVGASAVVLNGWEIDFCIALWSSIIEIFEDTHSCSK